MTPYYQSGSVTLYKGDCRQILANLQDDSVALLLADLIKTSTRPGDIVLDCFAGSGATGIAAKITGRRAILIEQEESYCQMIRRRLENDTPLFDFAGATA